MDGQIEKARSESAAAAKGGRYSSGHLMCRTPLWGVAAFLGCAYFTWISFAHVRSDGPQDWPHDWWTAATYIVWIILLTGLAFDTRCLRERLFFGLLVINFVIGFGLTLWRGIPAADVRSARLGTGALWAVAALAGLSTVTGAPKLPPKENSNSKEQVREIRSKE